MKLYMDIMSMKFPSFPTLRASQKKDLIVRCDVLNHPELFLKKKTS